VASLDACREPSFLVPFPFAGRPSAQNALILPRQVLAVVLPESELTDERLPQELTGLLSTPIACGRMSSRSKTLGTPMLCSECVNGHSPRTPIQAAYNPKGRQARYRPFLFCSMT